MDSQESHASDPEKQGDFALTRIWEEIGALLPLQREQSRQEQLAAIWIRELPVHWVAIQFGEQQATLLKSSIEQKWLDSGRILQRESPSATIGTPEWNEGVLWEFRSCETSDLLGYVRLARSASDVSVAHVLRVATQWLLGSSARWESDLLAAKLESLAEFSAGAGHEINNPLGTILGRVQLLLMKESDPARRQMLEIIGGQALRVRDMIGDVMLFARPPHPEPQEIQVSEWFSKNLARTQELALKQGTALQVDIPDDLTMWGDPVQASIALGAILQNSLNALQSGGSIRVSARHHRPEDQGSEVVRLVCEDDGPGLTEVERQHLFDPFFSGRQAGRGLGFGLSKAWRIVVQHQGRIFATELLPHGLRLTIDWPVSPSAPLKLRETGDRVGSK